MIRYALVIAVAVIARSDRAATADPAPAPCTEFVQCKLIIAPDPIDFGDVPTGTSVTANATLTNKSLTTVTSWTFTLTGGFTFDAPCSPGATTCAINPSSVPNNGQFMPAPVVRCNAGTGLQTGVFSVTGDTFSTAVDVFCNGVSGTQAEVDWDPIGPLTSHVGTPTTAVLHVRNQGNATLHYQLAFDAGTGPAADWQLSMCGAVECTIAPGGPQANITVTFTPGDIFDRSIDLILTTDDPDEGSVPIHIVATGQAGRIMVIDPPAPPLAFGQVPLAIQSAPKPITVENVGNVTLNNVTGAITAGASSYQTPLVGTATLMPGQQATFDVTCTPDAIGARPGTFTVSAPSADPTTTIPIAMTCEGIDSQLEISPASIGFGRVRVGTTVGPMSIALINHDSGLAAPLGAATVAPADSSYALTGAPTGGESLPAGGGNTSFTVAFTPAARGVHDVAITGIDPTDATRVVSLTGRGVIADYVLSPAVIAIDLGTACRGTAIDRELSLVATEDAVLTVTDVGLESGVDYTMTMVTPGSLPAMLDPEAPGMTTATVSIDVVAIAGTVTDKLIWTTDRTPGDTTEVQLTLTAIESGLAVSPGHIDFGTVMPASSTDAEVTAQLCGAGGDTVTATLDGDAEFTLIGAPVATVDSTQSMPWSVRFAPATAGDYSATLHLVPATGPEVTVSIAGRADDPTGGDDDSSGLTNYYNCGCSGATSGTGGAMIAVVLMWQARRRRRRTVR